MCLAFLGFTVDEHRVRQDGRHELDSHDPAVDSYGARNARYPRWHFATGGDSVDNSTSLLHPEKS
jgi:hypothetical protein